MRILAAALVLLLAVPAFGQSVGTVVLHGPSFDATLPQVTPEAIATAVNTGLAAKADASEVARATGAEALLAPLASPALTGIPTTPTAAPGTNTLQMSSTAFSAAAVLVETSRAIGAEGLLAPKASPTFTGIVNIPLGATIVGFAPLASPAFTGIPTVPTASPGTNTTQAASVAFVTTAVVAATTGVSSVNTRTGAVTLGLSDIAGAAPLASPALTGIPTTPTASPGTNTSQLASTAFNAASVLVETNRAIAAEAVPSPGALFGMTLSNSGGSPNTLLVIAAGSAADSTNAVNIALGVAISKSTTGSWASGIGANGMGSGLTVANSTWYHVFAIINSGAADVYFDTSITAADKPAGTTAFRRVGSFLTDGSAHIILFTQNGDEFLWGTSPAANVAGVIGDTVAHSLALAVPIGITVNAMIRAALTDPSVADGALFTSLAGADQAPSGTGTPGDSVGVAAATAASAGHFNIRTNVSQQIRYRLAAATGNLTIVTYGWIDTRGRLN
jgi:hypothetical protein